MSASWTWLLLACVVAFATKLSGYLVPARWLEGPRVRAVSAAATIGLLASLVVVNTVADGARLAVDARLGALLVALVALRLRVPFLGVVVLGAAAAAVLRWSGTA